MTDLATLYGKNYAQEDLQQEQFKFVDQIASNIAHLELPLALDRQLGWNPSLLFLRGPQGPQGRMRPQLLERLLRKIRSFNEHMQVMVLEGDQRKILPWLIIDQPVEYLLIKDCRTKKLHVVYICPVEVGAY